MENGKSSGHRPEEKCNNDIVSLTTVQREVFVCPYTEHTAWDFVDLWPIDFTPDIFFYNKVYYTLIKLSAT